MVRRRWVVVVLSMALAVTGGVIPTQAVAAASPAPRIGHAPVVVFPAFHFTKLRVVVHDQHVDSRCPRSGTFQDWFQNSVPSGFSQVCRDELLTLRYDPDPRLPMARRFSDQRGVSVGLLDYGSYSSAPFYAPLYAALEKAGCHVVYGLMGLKTHCKTCLVVRQEKGQLRRYAHIGTGNYNPKTARIYEDLGLLTADPEIGADLTDLFNTLTGYSRQTEYRTLMVAPHGVRAGLVERIEREAGHARAGRPSGVLLKANSVVDEQVIDALYRASRDDVPIRLLVRGICALRPGVPGLSETITVRSIVGRFLEHSRVMVFGTPDRTQDPLEQWLGSADLMHRNLDRRVETLVRVKDPTVQAQIQQLLGQAMADDIVRWELQSDGSWTRLPEPGWPAKDLQAELVRQASERPHG